MEFEFHQRPNASRLESAEKEIVAMRSASWPYQRIAEWLSAEKNLSVTKEAVRQFCNVRSITKGSRKNQQCRSTAPPTSAPTDGFDFDDTGPIETKKNR